MRYLYNRKRGLRSTEGERFQFAFLVVGVIVLLVVAFVLGLQVGRIVEKKAAERRNEANKFAGPIETAEVPGSEIQKDLGVFSEEAAKVPPVTPPSTDAHLNETEKSLTFPETLAKKEPEPVLLVKPESSGKATGTPSARSGSAGNLMVQVAAFRDRGAAENLRTRLQKGGFRVLIVTKGGYHRVRVGPYPDKDAANQAIRKLKADWKMTPFLVGG